MLERLREFNWFILILNKVNKRFGAYVVFKVADDGVEYQIQRGFSIS